MIHSDPVNKHTHTHIYTTEIQHLYTTYTLLPHMQIQIFSGLCRLLACSNVAVHSCTKLPSVVLTCILQEDSYHPFYSIFPAQVVHCGMTHDYAIS